MAIEAKKTGNCEYEVKYVLKDQELVDAREKALKELAKNISIKGFRKGNAPLNLVRERVNPSDLLNRTINVSINPILRKILVETKLRPAMTSDVRVDNVTDEGIELTYTIVTEPTVTLGKYKDIKIKKEPVKVTKEDVEEAIEKELKDNADLVLKDTPAEMGDTLVFDFKGYIDGKEFEGGSAENYSLVLGSNQFIPGFEDQLVGATSDSKVDVIVTFPEQYIKSLAGKEAKFVCMVHEVKGPSTPTLDDEFVKGLGIENVNTVEEYKKHKEADLLAKKEREASNVQFNTLVETVINNATLEVSDKLLEQEANAIKEENIRRITQNGLTFEQYKEVTGIDDEEFHKQAKEVALNDLKRVTVFNEIAKEEKLTVTRNDLDNYYQNVANTYGMKVEEVKKALASNESNIVRNLIDGKIQNFLYTNNIADKKEVKEAEKVEEAKEETEETKKASTKKTTSKKSSKKVEEKGE